MAATEAEGGSMDTRFMGRQVQKPAKLNGDNMEVGALARYVPSILNYSNDLSLYLPPRSG